MASYAATLDKSLLNIVKGVYSIEEFSQRIVRSAVSDTISIISEKYGLNSIALAEELVEPLVEKHARVTSGCQKCTAITYRGKKCTQDVVADGYCQLHSRQVVVEKKPTKKRGAGIRDDTVTKVMRLLTSATQRTGEDQRSSKVYQSVCHKSSPTSQ